MPHPRLPLARPARHLRTILITLAVLFAGWLVFGPKPWSDGVAAAEAAGEKVRTAHHVATGLWRASLINLVLCLALLPFVRSLARPLEGTPPRLLPGGGANARNAGRWLLLSILGAMAFTCWQSAPRLDHSLWHDEAKGVRNFVVGRYDRSKSSGEVRYREVTLLENVWNYRFPNHTFFGILARASHRSMPPAAGRDDRFFVNEAAIRLPSLLGALGGLGAVALLLHGTGYPRAALLVPWLLAVHPWFMRYAAEARGYSLLFLFGPLCIALAGAGLRDGRWRWWLGLGLCQFLLVWSVLNSLYLLLVLNAAVAAWLFSHRRDTTVPALAGRWLLSGLVSAALAVWFMMPLLPQFLDYLQSTGKDPAKYGRDMVRDMLSAYTAGMRYRELGGGGGGHMRGNAAAMALAGAVAVFALSGAWRLWCRGAGGRLALAVLLLPAPLFYLHCTLKQPHIFYWYVIFGLPLFWAVVAVGCSAAGDGLRARSGRGGAALAPGFALLVAIWFTGGDKRRFLREHPIEAERESVLAVRGSFSDPTAAGFGAIVMLGFCRDPILYDVRSEYAGDAKRFREALARADTAGKPVYVNYGPLKAYQHFGNIMKMVDDPELFEPVAEFEGIDNGTDRVVKKYRPGSIARDRRGPAGS